jgi:hypothetical protein
MMQEHRLSPRIRREVGRSFRWFRQWYPEVPMSVLAGDEGMSTAEYAIGTVAAAAFAAVLYAVVTSDSVLSGLTDLVQRALTVNF